MANLGAQALLSMYSPHLQTATEEIISAANFNGNDGYALRYATHTTSVQALVLHLESIQSLNSCWEQRGSQFVESFASNVKFIEENVTTMRMIVACLLQSLVTTANAKGKGVAANLLTQLEQVLQRWCRCEFTDRRDIFVLDQLMKPIPMARRPGTRFGTPIETVLPSPGTADEDDVEEQDNNIEEVPMVVDDDQQGLEGPQATQARQLLMAPGLVAAGNERLRLQRAERAERRARTQTQRETANVQAQEGNHARHGGSGQTDNNVRQVPEPTLSFEEEPHSGDWSASVGIRNLRAYDSNNEWQWLLRCIIHFMHHATKKPTASYDDVDEARHFYSSITQRKEETVRGFLGREALAFNALSRACTLHGIDPIVPTWYRVLDIRGKLKTVVNDELSKVLSRKRIPLNALSYSMLKELVENIEEMQALIKPAYSSSSSSSTNVSASKTGGSYRETSSTKPFAYKKVMYPSTKSQKEWKDNGQNSKEGLSNDSSAFPSSSSGNARKSTFPGTGYYKRTTKEVDCKFGDKCIMGNKCQFRHSSDGDTLQAAYKGQQKGHRSGVTMVTHNSGKNRLPVIKCQLLKRCLDEPEEQRPTTNNIRRAEVLLMVDTGSTETLVTTYFCDRHKLVPHVLKGPIVIRGFGGGQSTLTHAVKIPIKLGPNAEIQLHALVTDDFNIPFGHRAVLLGHSALTKYKYEIMRGKDCLNLRLKVGPTSVDLPMKPELDSEDLVLNIQPPVMDLSSPDKSLIKEAKEKLKGYVPIKLHLKLVDETYTRPNVKPYDVPRAMRGAVDICVKALVDSGVLTKVNKLPSEGKFWVSSMFFKMKRDNIRARCLVDFRALNKASYHLGMRDGRKGHDMAGLVTIPKDVEFFSCVDVGDAFFTVSVGEECKNLLLTVMPLANGQHAFYRVNRCPQGLHASPLVWCEHIEDLLSRADNQWHIFCRVFVDDILITGRTYAECEYNTLKVVAILKAAGKKTTVSAIGPSANICGLTFTAEGYTISAANCQRLKEALKDPPSSYRGLRTILGACQYARSLMCPATKRLSHFAGMVKPFYDLLAGNPKGRLSTEAKAIIDQNWRTLHDSIEPRPLQFLSSTDDITGDLCWVLISDASDVGCGAGLYYCHGIDCDTVLIEDIVSRGRLVNILAHVFTSVERRWATYDQELYGVVLGLRKFGPLVYSTSNKLLILTDNKACMGTIRNDFKMVTPDSVKGRRYLSWLDEISPYLKGATIRHVEGGKNNLADLLSRVTNKLTGDNIDPDKAIQQEGVVMMIRQVPSDESQDNEDTDDGDINYTIPRDLIEEAALGANYINNPLIPHELEELFPHDTYGVGELGPDITDDEISSSNNDTVARGSKGDDDRGSSGITLIDPEFKAQVRLAQLKWKNETYKGIKLSELSMLLYSGATCPLPDRFILRDNIIYFQDGDNLKLCIPPDGEVPFQNGVKSYRDAVAYLCHDVIGHPRVDGTILEAKSRFWFPGMKALLRSYVKSCASCLMNDNNATLPVHAPGGIMPVPPEQLDTIFLDHCQLKTSGNNPQTAHILVVLESRTGLTKYLYVNSPSAEDTVSVLISDWLPSHGVPIRVHSDRGSVYTSAVFTSLMLRLGVKQSYSLGYNPQSNGRVERKVRSLKAMCRHYRTPTSLGLMRVYLGILSYMINMKTHGSGSSPFQRLYGFKPTSAVGCLFSVGELQDTSEEVYYWHAAKACETYTSFMHDASLHAQDRAFLSTAAQTHVEAGDMVVYNRQIYVVESVSTTSVKLQNRDERVPLRLLRKVPPGANKGTINDISCHYDPLGTLIDMSVGARVAFGNPASLENVYMGEIVLSERPIMSSVKIHLFMSLGTSGKYAYHYRTPEGEDRPISDPTQVEDRRRSTGDILLPYCEVISRKFIYCNVTFTPAMKLTNDSKKAVGVMP